MVVSFVPVEDELAGLIIKPLPCPSIVGDRTLVNDFVTNHTEKIRINIDPRIIPKAAFVVLPNKLLPLRPKITYLNEPQRRKERKERGKADG
ncbi:MAG: hypothetical protein SAK29_12880 [Scytonema sp. PMC 1069.18]|nr:hypothetical protein [Scytonema sp. PMC 1069.18]MEC4886590.1 hypothetical protein [Scytonema sp. PMC 1070.18]